MALLEKSELKTATVAVIAVLIVQATWSAATNLRDTRDASIGHADLAVAALSDKVERNFMTGSEVQVRLDGLKADIAASKAELVGLVATTRAEVGGQVGQLTAKVDALTAALESITRRLDTGANR